MRELIQAWPLTSVAIAFLIGDVIGLTALSLIVGARKLSPDDDEVIEFTTRRGAQ